MCIARAIADARRDGASSRSNRCAGASAIWSAIDQPAQNTLLRTALLRYWCSRIHGLTLEFPPQFPVHVALPSYD